ncbi:MAG: hypothetical protein Q6358_10055 [Candidatus Brocadiales bacterium]|nr:hypothetical protein [Candidatus Brocadiales bacterium]
MTPNEALKTDPLRGRLSSALGAHVSLRGIRMQFPDRTREIEIHRAAARQLRERGDYAGARSSYFKWVESVRQQNINSGGSLEQDLREAKQEYSEFVKTDPLYMQIRDAITKKTGEKPGILQTELYTTLPQFEKTDIQYALYFMDDHRAIVRIKKGRTYSLSLP